MDADAAAIKYLDVTDAGATTIKTMDITAAAAEQANPTMKYFQYSQITFRNNTTMNCKIDFYWITTKRDTDIALGPTIYQGWNDVYNSSLASLSNLNVNYDLRNNKQFFQQFRIDKIKRGTLMSGKEINVNLQMKKPFNYDPHSADNNGVLSFRNVTRYLLVRIGGVIAHDTTNVSTEIGITRSQVDWTIRDVQVYSLVRKLNTSFYSITGALDTPSNGFEFADEQEGKMEQEEE